MPAPSNIVGSIVPDSGVAGDTAVLTVSADGAEVETLRPTATNIEGNVSVDVIFTKNPITYTVPGLPIGWTAVERPSEPGVFDCVVG